MKKFYFIIVFLFLTIGTSFSQTKPTLSIPDVCEGDDLILTILDPVAGALYYITGPNNFDISTNSINVTISHATLEHNGEYSLYVQPPGGSLSFTEVATAVVLPKPTANFTMDQNDVILEDEFVRINFADLSTNAVYWLWNFGDVHSTDNESSFQTPYHDFTEQGRYQVSLTVQSMNGCKDMMSKSVIVAVPFRFFIPNVFSPNGDAVNDEFCVKGDGFILENFSMRIYNRTNTLIYQSEYIYDCWDGRHKGKYCPPGIYTAIIKVTTFREEVKEYIVPVTLIK
jgi:gliding motility-associated-like protein